MADPGIAACVVGVVWPGRQECHPGTRRRSRVRRESRTHGGSKTPYGRTPVGNDGGKTQHSRVCAGGAVAPADLGAGAGCGALPAESTAAVGVLTTAPPRRSHSAQAPLPPAPDRPTRQSHTTSYRAAKFRTTLEDKTLSRTRQSDAGARPTSDHGLKATNRFGRQRPDQRKN